MKVAAVKMPTKFCQVEENLIEAEQYVKEAAKQGSEIIVFPEFFTTGFALHQDLLKAIKQSNGVRQAIQKMSTTYKIAIGGSYLIYDEEKKGIYNEFGLYFPTGEQYFHCKDIPTGIESFCYEAGDDVSAFETPLGRIGIAMCWEQLRWATVRRMIGKIDLLIGGSCWWTFTKEDGEQLYTTMSGFNEQLALNAPSQLAKLLGVPYIHASHDAVFQGGTLMNPAKMCNRPIVGHALVTNAQGEELVTLKKAGVVYEEITMGAVTTEIEIPDKMWIVDLPQVLEQGFYQLNEKYHQYYMEHVKGA